MTTHRFLMSAWDLRSAPLAVCVALLVLELLGRRGRSAGQVVWLLLAAATLVFTLCSPVNALADGYLFSAHMLQHLLLLLIVPVFWMASLPAYDLSPSARPSAVSGYALMRHPWFGWACGVGGMWFWHAPTLCNAAVSNVWVHRLQSISLVAMGLLFWWPVTGPLRRLRLAPLKGMIYLFSACLACTVLGIIIAFSPVEVCSIYAHPQDRLGLLPLIRNVWGLTPATDQQLGGLLMWVPACFIYMSGIFVLFARWHRSKERESND